MTEVCEIVAEMNRLMEAARLANIQMRVIGGLAVQVHGPRGHEAFQREYPDIDFVVSKKDRPRLEGFFRSLGYLPDKYFNALNGNRRQIYYHQNTSRHIDVFIGDFEMCHKLPMRDRLHLDPVTVPLADLLLSKLQIVELNRKDALDIVALLLNNELGRDDDGKINLHRVVSLCIRYWGLYWTVLMNLSRVEDALLNGSVNLTADERQIVLSRIERIRRMLTAMSKPLFWKIRDRFGTRLRWYTEVEEIRR